MSSKRSVDINQFFIIKGQIHDVAHACMNMMNCVTLYYLQNVTCLEFYSMCLVEVG